MITDPIGGINVGNVSWKCKFLYVVPMQFLYVQFSSVLIYGNDVFMVWSGLGTNTNWLGLGKDSSLADLVLTPSMRLKNVADATDTTRYHSEISLKRPSFWEQIVDSDALSKISVLPVLLPLTWLKNVPHKWFHANKCCNDISNSGLSLGSLLSSSSPSPPPPDIQVSL